MCVYERETEERERARTHTFGDVLYFGGDALCSSGISKVCPVPPSHFLLPPPRTFCSPPPPCAHPRAPGSIAYSRKQKKRYDKQNKIKTQEHNNSRGGKEGWKVKEGHVYNIHDIIYMIYVLSRMPLHCR